MVLNLKKKVKKVIPEKYLSLYSHYRKKYFNANYTISYAQEGEDLILNRFFETQKTGFYIDVGAHHPKRFSNTYFFYKKGWHGINIDAMPHSMKIFEKIRPRDINIEAAIYNEQKELTYYEFNEPALNGFSKDLSEQRNRLNQYKIINQYQIKTKTLDEVLKQYQNKIPQKIDFLSIDVEGLDFAVLKAIDLSLYKPKLILIEILSSSLNEIANHEITIYLEKFNYKFHAKSFNTVFYISY